jgi:hypothetical protein
MISIFQDGASRKRWDEPRTPEELAEEIRGLDEDWQIEADISTKLGLSRPPQRLTYQRQQRLFLKVLDIQLTARLDDAFCNVLAQALFLLLVRAIRNNAETFARELMRILARPIGRLFAKLVKRRK